MTWSPGPEITFLILGFISPAMNHSCFHQVLAFLLGFKGLRTKPSVGALLITKLCALEEIPLPDTWQSCVLHTMGGNQVFWASTARLIHISIFNTSIISMAWDLDCHYEQIAFAVWKWLKIMNGINAFNTVPAGVKSATSNHLQYKVLWK